MRLFYRLNNLLLKNYYRNSNKMDYLLQLYGKFFSVGSACEIEKEPPKIVAFGNVLLDRTVKLPDPSTFERFKISLDSKGELDLDSFTNLFAETCERYECSTNSGGSALNTVGILKHLDENALFIGAVGDDEVGDNLREILRAKGINSSLQKISDSPTGQCLCLLYKETVTHYAHIGASSKFNIEHLNVLQASGDAFLRPNDRKQIVYIEGFFIPQREEVCKFITEQYIKNRRRLAINLSSVYIVQENTEEILRLARSAYFIFGNEAEFAALAKQSGADSIEACAQNLLDDGNETKIIVVTKGFRGVQLISNYIDELSRPGDVTYQNFNVPRVENVVDATGAGDTFAAGFLHAWLQKRSLSECIRVAADLSAKVVTQIGCNLPQ